MIGQKDEATSFWNNRYNEAGYAYGIEQSLFVKDSLEDLESNSRILFPAEGEGRNAVYAAKKGFDVHAFDYSEVARNNALHFAKKSGVDISYQVGGLEDLNYKPASFDAVVLVYAHFFPEIRKSYHQKLVYLLKPNGKIILEGFNQKQLFYNSKNPLSGGPKRLDMLFTKEMLLDDFRKLNNIEITENVALLDEGNFHKGEGSLIRFIGRTTK